MNKLLLALFLGFCVVVASGQTTIRQTSEETFECLMTERMQVIEQIHGIKFDKDWKPRVCFGYPDDLTKQKKLDWYAEYFSTSQSFLLSPELRYQNDVSLADHELGHALMDQISRRSGNGPWFNLERMSKMSAQERISIKILSEGVATYFEYKGDPPDKDGDENGVNFLPEGPEHYGWKGNSYKYKGGRWIVAPIIRNYGERGIIYLITHPMVYHYDQVRTGAKAYQAKALKELGATATLRPTANWGVNSFSKLVFFVIVNI